MDNSDLKAVFDNALMTHGYGNSNPKFLQCSNNIKITGKNNPYAECFEIKQIFINDEPILDENAYPIKNSKKYSCAVDSYIANGGQGYKVLQQADKKDAFKDSKLLRLNDVLMESLIKAAEKYPKGSEYPYYQINVEND